MRYCDCGANPLTLFAQEDRVASLEKDLASVTQQVEDHRQLATLLRAKALARREWNRQAVSGKWRGMFLLSSLLLAPFSRPLRGKLEQLKGRLEKALRQQQEEEARQEELKREELEAARSNTPSAGADFDGSVEEELRRIMWGNGGEDEEEDDGKPLPVTPLPSMAALQRSANKLPSRREVRFSPSANDLGSSGVSESHTPSPPRLVPHPEPLPRKSVPVPSPSHRRAAQPRTPEAPPTPPQSTPPDPAFSVGKLGSHGSAATQEDLRGLKEGSISLREEFRMIADKFFQHRGKASQRLGVPDLFDVITSSSKSKQQHH